ncbi:hypothetical protein D3C81_1619850 [compost metagenome]
MIAFGLTLSSLRYLSQNHEFVVTPRMAITRPGITFPFSPPFDRNAINSIATPLRHIAIPTQRLAMRSRRNLRSISTSSPLYVALYTAQDTTIAASSAVRRMKSANCVDDFPSKSPIPTTMGPGELINTDASKVFSPDLALKASTSS